MISRPYVKPKDIATIIRDVKLSDPEREMSALYFFNDAFPQSLTDHLPPHEFRAYVQVFDEHLAAHPDFRPSKSQLESYGICLDIISYDNWPSW